MNSARAHRPATAVLIGMALLASVGQGRALAQEIREDLVFYGTCRVGQSELHLYRSSSDSVSIGSGASAKSLTVFQKISAPAEKADETLVETVSAEWVQPKGAPAELRFPRYWPLKSVSAKDCKLAPASAKAPAPAKLQVTVKAKKPQSEVATAIPAPLGEVAEVRGYWVSPAVPASDETGIAKLVAREDALPLKVGVICVESAPESGASLAVAPAAPGAASDSASAQPVKKAEFRACPKLRLISTSVTNAPSSPSPLSAILLPFSASE